MKHTVIAILLAASFSTCAQTFMDSIQCVTLIVPRLHTVSGPPYHPIVTDSSGNKYEYRIIPGKIERGWYRCSRLILYSRLTGCKSPVYIDEYHRYFILPVKWEKP